MEKKYKSVEALTHGLLEQLQSKFYGKDTLNNYRKILKTLALYMQQDKIPAYSPEIGNAFIEDYTSTHEISDSFQSMIRTIIGRLSDYNDGRKYSCQRKKSPVKLPENYAVLLEDYLSFCEHSGNRAGTIKGKRKSCEDFLIFLITLECNDIEDISSTQICKACLMFHNKDAWAVIRMFLKYCY
ncbi:hypothetical protein [Desulfosporosinus metallidurans]|uniref:Core-binding (CB) domain-containing protein n=1 Tax=Desulfosporosinus metallidurans TaxID=1888891 RepID=A0A1Q8QBX1_9FIRM|nr:hypothetical protein [Desulfosporosinus metallidurans]OLN24792.1 hypothetical protein DSOL_5403 [Desulfosporosinus metallidurans]